MDDAVALRAAEQPRLSGRALRILSDEKLAAMVAGGSDDAFATLYQRHHQGVYRYCLSLLREEADARDALQSSMLSALSSLRKRPIEGAFKPWLFRIAHNESISIIRGRAKDAPAEAASTVAFTEDHETREELRSLVSDLGALPDRQRGAIVMREMSGLSYAEIAAALGTSEAGGKQLVYEARSALQDLREGHEMSCELVRERISENDRRLLRGRKVRSHLRGCQPCQDYEEAIRRRRTAFALLAPPLAPVFAVAVLQDVFAGGGGGSGGAGGAGAAAGAGGAASGTASVAVPAALKVAAAVLVVGAAGAGAYGAANALFAGPAASAPAAQAAPEPSTGPAGGHGARDGSGHASRTGPGRGGDGGAGPAANARAKPGGPGGTAGEKPSAAGDTGSPGAPGGSDDGAGTNSPGGGSGGGSDGPGPAPVDPPPPTSPPPTGGGGGSSPPPSGGGGGSSPPAGTPAGHGGTPPGQGGTPPGQAGGSIPPGHINNPGKGGGKP